MNFQFFVGFAKVFRTEPIPIPWSTKKLRRKPNKVSETSFFGSGFAWVASHAYYQPAPWTINLWSGRTQLTLGVPFFRCGVLSWTKKKISRANTYLLSPSGENISSFSLGLLTTILPSGNGLHWRFSRSILRTWSQQAVYRFCSDPDRTRPRVTDRKKYQQGETPPEKTGTFIWSFQSRGCLLWEMLEPFESRANWVSFKP